MKPCLTCRDRLLDHAYGLLEESELRDMQEHLAVCAACQAAMDEVQAEQHLLATAARAITEVQEFALPRSTPAPSSLPDTMPMTAAPQPKRALWQRTWVSWSAAAAVLFAVGASLAFYRYQVSSLQGDLAAKRDAYKVAATEFAALPAKYDEKQKLIVHALLTKAEPHVRIVGPTTLLPGAKGHLHITTRHADGTPAKADLIVKLVDAETGKPVQRLRLACDKQTVVELDVGATAPNRVLHLFVEADTGAAKARVQETLRTLAPTYATRIDTNKAAYQLRDVLFFRVLVLDRFSLTPPAQPIPMRVELLDAAGKIVRALTLPTGDGGILAREFAIDEKFQAGSYSLNVRAADISRGDVQPAAQRFEIVRELLLPDFVFDKARYLPGEEVTGLYRGLLPLPAQAMIGPESVKLLAEPMAPGAGGGPGGAGLGQEKKKAGPLALYFAGPQRFAASLPPRLPAGADGVNMSMKLGEGAKQVEVNTVIPLAPTAFSIDFFPEGGDLIAGVENRVYYRVRAKSGEPITSDGQVILMTGTGDVVDSSYELGMGFFDFTPNAKETYTARITTPQKIETIAAPFAKLGIRPDGVVIQVAAREKPHAPRAVGTQGDPIHLTLRQHGPARQLLVVAQCRGQIVDQRWVEVGKKEVFLTLQPTPDAVGMIRVTAFELSDRTGIVAAQSAGVAKEKILVPVADRLVYRAANHRLEMGFQLNTQQLHGGQKLTGKITAREDDGQSSQAWALASVIDERFQARPRSLSAHFFLLNEIRTGPDLDNAQLILHDGAASAAVLERFLGTHGWRRYIRRQEPALGILTDAAKRPAQPLVFSRENRSLTALQEQEEGKLDVALAPIRHGGFQEKAELETRVADLADAAQTAATNLHRFEETIQLWFRLGLGLTLAILLGAALILMGIGLYRSARAQPLATSNFGWAFGCLMLCMVILFAGARLGPVQFVLSQAPDVAAAGKAIDRHLTEQFARLPVNQPVVEKSFNGAFFAAAAPLNERQDVQMIAENKGEQERAAKDAMQQLRMVARRGQPADGTLSADRKNTYALATSNEALAKRLEAIREIGKADAKANVTPAPPPMGPPNARAHDLPGDAAYFFEYASTPNVPADTLLWHPTLVLHRGNAEVRFDLPSGQGTTYRVLLLGHTSTGRFGFFETRLDVP